MDITNLYQIKGQIRIESFSPKGILQSSLVSHNLVLSEGDALVASKFCNNAPATDLNIIALGTGSNPVSKTDISLGAEVTRTNIYTGVVQGTGAKINTFSVFAAFPPFVSGATIDLMEAGVFFSTKLFSRTVFGAAFPVAQGESVAVNWEYTILGV